MEPKNGHLNPKYQCVFCSSRKHSSHLCRRYNSNEKFYHQVVNEKRCKNCLRQFHRSDRCLDDSFCAIKSCNRKDKHSPCVCRKRFPQSVWSELYDQNISEFKKNGTSKRNQPTIWSELYQRNILNISNDKTPSKNDGSSFCSDTPLSLSQKNIHPSSKENCITQCLTVSNMTTTENLNSRATQTVNFNSQGTQTDEKSCYSSVSTSSSFHSLDESERMTSSSAHVSPCDKFQSRLTAYLKTLYAIFCYCKIKQSISTAECKVQVLNSTSTKDHFLNILT